MLDKVTPELLPDDIDSLETNEWLDALSAIIEREGHDRAQFIIETLIDRARRSGVWIPFSPHTAYVNTIPTGQEQRSPGDADLEWKLRSLIRWNALAMVIRANRKNAGLGGHISSFASAATLYDVGFNHFWRARNEKHAGDMVFIQGHSAPGIYARAYLEGRLSEEQLDNFRQEVDGSGLSSYPHPWLMPDFWQFPTVSMGLGPIMGIYQARFMRYLHNRGLIDGGDRKVWVFCGDGEMDEPESLGAISLAGREKLDNLIFVINCNLQRLDGPVRGNGKIIQELEGEFRGGGWNVLKVIWGSYWDPLLMRDTQGLLRKRMGEAVDGEYQAFKAHGGAYTREKFFGKYPELLNMVSNMSDEDVWRLNRGGHDPHKVYAAYAAAAEHQGQPTVILAKTVKGYGMGESGEGQNITHQQKKMGHDSLIAFRDRFNIPLSDDEVDEAAYYRPPEDSPEMKYLHERRSALGGYLPSRITAVEPLQIPEISAFDAVIGGSGEREISTTMAFVRILQALTRDKNIGKQVVPIVPDESRTFGMEGMFRQLGIYAHMGQLYEPEDSDQLAYYREDQSGQVLQEGINEAGAMCSWIAAGTSYSNHGVQMIPFFIFYSMFGFQRVGDLAWAAADIQSRGFLIGGTAGRTTLAGEGLQHQDGHSHVLASTIPNVVSYDPTYGFELAVIIHDGLKRMYQDHENVYYYLTCENENYMHPAMPEGVEDQILKGMYRLSRGTTAGETAPAVQLLGCGSILREVIRAGELLAEDFGVASDVWSVTSFNQLARDGQSAERWNTLHPDQPQRVSFVEQQLADSSGPVVAATDYIKAYSEQIREFVPRRYVTLGTDGFGRSDTREDLRRHFEVNASFVVVSALSALVREGAMPASCVSEAISKYGVNADKPDPVTL